MAQKGQKMRGIFNMLMAHLALGAVCLPFPAQATTPIDNTLFSLSKKVHKSSLQLLPQNPYFSWNNNKYLLFAQAQENSKERGIFKVDNVSGNAGHRLAIRIELPTQSFSKKASLIFQGFPNEVLLSPGSRVNDVWIVPLIDAPDLTIISPHSYEGTSQVTVILSEENNKIIEAQKFSMSILSTRPSSTQTRSSENKEYKTDKTAEQSKPVKTKLTNPEITTQSLGSSKQDAVNQKDEKEKPSSAQKDFQPKTGLDKKLQTVMMEKADKMLSIGDIEGARSSLRFLAEHGDSEAALKLGKTYDPVELKKYNPIGLKPDSEQAKLWYERAVQMGNENARQYLDAIVANK